MVDRGHGQGCGDDSLRVPQDARLRRPIHYPLSTIHHLLSTSSPLDMLLNPVPIHEIADRWIGKFERGRLRALAELKKKLEGETDG
ncbi:MAG: transcriptional regulator [Planctomycetaceae bacterium]|nr:transcriptional regulator [Planctomycetaceae bacterium]